MGLFSNSKKPCPICGAPTPRLLPTKVEGMPICKECSAKVDLPNGMPADMTLDGFKKYLAYYEANGALRERFREQYRFDFGLCTGWVLIDFTNGLFRVHDADGAFVFEKSALKSFRVLEDKEVLFEGSAAGLKCHESKNPERAWLMATMIDRFNERRAEHERILEMERVRYLNRPREEWWDREREIERDKPRFTEAPPFRRFNVELKLDHPYWPEYEGSVNAPDYDDDCPSVEGYLHRYQEQVDTMYDLSHKLMQLIAPNAPETGWGTESAAAAPEVVSGGDTVEELKRYKELLDAGILTAEEFSAKKKQLLGI